MRHHLSRRKFLHLLGGATGAGLLAACVPAAPVVETEGEAGSAAGEAAEPASAGEALTAWHIWSGGRLPLMDDMFARFNEAHPDLNATHEFVSGGSGQLLQKIQTSIAAGDPPDVAMIRHWWVPALVVRNSLLALDGMIDSNGIDLNDFFDYTLEPCRWNGSLYVLPADGSPYPLLLYNTDHYAEAGLDPAAPPETWDELIEMGKALVRFEEGNLVNLGVSWGGVPNFQLLTYLVRSNSGRLISDDARQYFFDSSEAIEALEFIVRLNDEVYGGADPLMEFLTAQAGLELDDPFRAGVASQALAGPWVVGLIETDETNLAYDAAPPPHAADSEGHAVYMGSWAYGIPSGVPNPDGSWELVEWLTHEPSAAGWFMQEQVRVPALRQSMADPVFDKYPQWDGILAQTSAAVGTTVTPVMQETNDIVNEALEFAVAGEMTPAEALAFAQKETQSLLNAFYEQQG